MIAVRINLARGCGVLSALLPLMLMSTAVNADAKPREFTVEIAKMRFGPVPKGMRTGDVLIWVNRDVVPHTATANDKSFDVIIPSRQSRRMVLRRAGSYAVVCTYHPGMSTTLVVAR